MNNLKHNIIKWLKAYAKQYNKKTFVIHLYNDIEPLLLSYLCFETKITTLNVLLPYFEPIDLLKKFIKYYSYQSEFINIRYKEWASYHFSYYNSSNFCIDPMRCVLLSDLANKHNGLVVGSLNKNDLFIRSYNKYSNWDLLPFGNIFKSELQELFDEIFVDKLEIFDNLQSDDGKISNNDIEWLYRENCKNNIITDEVDPVKNKAWQRYTLHQRKITAKMHQIEKLTRHKKITHIPIYR